MKHLLRIALIGVFLLTMPFSTQAEEVEDAEEIINNYLQGIIQNDIDKVVNNVND